MFCIFVVNLTVVLTTFMKSLTFGNRLGEVRKEKKISQDAFAKQLIDKGNKTRLFALMDDSIRDY